MSHPDHFEFRPASGFVGEASDGQDWFIGEAEDGHDWFRRDRADVEEYNGSPDGSDVGLSVQGDTDLSDHIGAYN